MSAVIMQKIRTRFEQESVRHLTTDQKAYAFDGYFHYSGKWLIEKNEALVHSVEFSLNPDFVGTKQRRFLPRAATAHGANPEQMLGQNLGQVLDQHLDPISSLM